MAPNLEAFSKMRLLKCFKTKEEVNLKSIIDSIFERCAKDFKQKRTKFRVKELNLQR